MFVIGFLIDYLRHDDRTGRGLLLRATILAGNISLVLCQHTHREPPDFFKDEDEPRAIWECNSPGLTLQTVSDYVRFDRPLFNAKQLLISNYLSWLRHSITGITNKWAENWATWLMLTRWTRC
jgi:hypothetical protein